MDIFKCIVARPPKARTAVFSGSNAFHKLEFLQFEQDDEHPYYDESPYLEALPGDSGSGFWTESFVQVPLSYRNTIVGVLMGSYTLKPLSDFSPPNDPNAKYQCRMFATKLTDEIIAWIKGKF